MSILAAACRKIGGGLFLLLVLTLMIGCAHLGHDPSSLSVPNIPTHSGIPSVPFYPQQAYQCGPAALAMVLGWTQANFSLQKLIPEVYTPARRGSLQSSLISAARRRNRLAYPIEGIEALLQELAADHPVIVLQNLGLKLFPRWHYAVLIGYDLTNDTFTLHSGKDASRNIRWTLFMRTWKRADHWGLVVLPPGQIPTSAEERPYLNAVVGLEQAGQWEGASSAYAAALKRWMHSIGALMGLGNSRYALGDLIGAEQAFRKAIKAYPQSGAAFNNLAQVLVEKGLYIEALEMARRAVALGGPNRDLFLQTLQEIESLQLKNR